MFKKSLIATMTGLFALVISSCGSENYGKRLDDYVAKFNIPSKTHATLNVPVKGTIINKDDVSITWTTDAEDATIDPVGGVIDLGVQPADASAKNVSVVARFTLTNKNKVVATAEKTFTVEHLVLALANGTFNYKYGLDSKERLEVLAIMEKYLLDKNIAIPLYSNSGAVMYSSRVTPISSEYLPVLGFGILQGGLSQPDSPGSTNYTYRSSTTSLPASFLYMNSSSSIEGTVYGYTAASLFDFYFNDNNDGFVLKPSAAKELTPFEPDENGLTNTWKIQLRDDLKWDDGTSITADDYIESYKILIDPAFPKYRRGLITSGTFEIVGANDYLSGKSDWETVGIKKVNDKEFTIELVNDINRWDFMYNCVDFLVHKATFDANTNVASKTTTYGTSPATYKSFGPYKLVEWDAQQELVFAKNEHYFESELYPNTGISLKKVADVSAQLMAFLNGDLDMTNIPAASYDTYKNDPRTKIIPGSTNFKININRMNQNQIDEFGATWNAKPILQEESFCEALYFAINRERLAREVNKTLTPELGHFSRAYFADVENTIPFRDTEEGKSVLEEYSPGTQGMNIAYAKSLYKEALTNLQSKGLLPENNKISIEFATFDDPQAITEGNDIKAQYEAAFNNIEGFEHITFEIVVAGQPGYDVYYQKQMIAQFDLALGGISGATLDPWSYLDIFMSNNLTGFFLNHGFDSSVPEIAFKDLIWSFDALVFVLNSNAVIENGNPVF